MSADRLSEYVARVVGEAPPLTDEQRERIARILHAGTRSNAAEAGGRR